MDVSRTNFFRSPARLDERAFEALFYEHYSAVYGVLFRLTGDSHEADDLTAETFWRLWERPPDRDENLLGWLYRVATRLGYNALRAGRRRERYETGGLAWNEPPPDPDRAAEQSEERAAVRAVLRELDLRDVQLLLLRHAGLPYKEIAAAVGIAPGSVGTLLARAEARFAARYRAGNRGSIQEGETDAPDR